MLTKTTKPSPEPMTFSEETFRDVQRHIDNLRAEIYVLDNIIDDMRRTVQKVEEISE